MILLRTGDWYGQDSFLVESMGDTWSRGEKWVGWFTKSEADFEEVE